MKSHMMKGVTINKPSYNLYPTADSSSEEEGQVIEETTSSPQSPVASTKPPLTQKRRGTLRLRLPARSNLPSSSSSPQTSSSSPPSMTTSPASTSLETQRWVPPKPLSCVPPPTSTCPHQQVPSNGERNSKK